MVLIFRHTVSSWCCEDRL